ncbi:MAG TPA: PDDEXK nuclease domain-containing protein, partial [Chitinispirillaceae bacterium]|nr:PDDEXK nuclease domain-containing protein [Chitinispirillaceae bacterium]
MAIKKAQKNSKLAKDSVLLNEIRALVQSSYQTVARYVNSYQVLLFWDIGCRVYKEILGERRADYGQKIVSTLSAQLQNEFGKGFSQRNLFRMVQFVQVFQDREKVSTLSTQLGWSHFVELITFDDGVKVQFYAEMCRIERWSVRTLRSRISSMLFERTAISKRPENIIKQEIKSLTEDDKISADLIFRDPYILDFLNIGEFYTEKDLESALIRELESFILELGAGFSFIARQKRITIDNTDYYIDLLFYNRLLKRLVAIDLKIGTFQASDKGQMELYLRWLEKHEMKTGEQPP